MLACSWQLREFVMPALKASQGRIDLLLQHHEANKVRVEMFYEREWPAAVKSLDGMTERLGRVERSLERNESDMRGMGERFNAAHSALGDKVDLIAADLGGTLELAQLILARREPKKD